MILPKIHARRATKTRSLGRARTPSPERKREGESEHKPPVAIATTYDLRDWWFEKLVRLAAGLGANQSKTLYKVQVLKYDDVK